MVIRGTILLILASALTMLYTNCGPGMDSRFNEYLSINLSKPNCEKHILYSRNVVIEGIANFEKRSVAVVSENSKVSNLTLSDPLSEPLPIQNAEVVVYNQYNQLVQCGKTDTNGNLKSLNGTDLTIPAAAGTYKVRVNARSKIDFGGNNNFMDIAVRKDIYQEEIHFLEKEVAVDGVNRATVTMTAKARQLDSENIEGGAFNILNSIQKTYEYIKSSTIGIDTSCMSKPLSVYWKAGFNPVQYEKPEADPSTLANTSYYSHKSKKLFITGGQLGNLSMANTDHFDDFAVIHELGHFIEDNCGQWTTPGGSHSIIVRIDPRLAWSEGWADFLAAQVINSKMSELDPSLSTKLINAGETYGWTYFFNSSGFSDSVQNIGNGQGFLIDFKRAGTDPGQWPMGTPYAGIEYDRVVPTIFPGEGHFREGAIARGLFKIANTCGAACTPSAISFTEIWKSFNRITGIGFDKNPFISSHDFFENLKTRITLSTAQETTINNEALQLRSSGAYLSGGTTFWVPYAHRLVQTAGACNLKLQARPDDNSLTGGQSDQRYSNHFYTLDLFDPTLAGLTEITVTFTKIAGTNVDHDLILFKPNYLFNDDYKCSEIDPSTGICSGSWLPQRITTSDMIDHNRTPATTVSTTYFKTLDKLDTLDKSNYYLLDLRAYTANIPVLTSTEYSYVISSNLGPLCPQ